MAETSTIKARYTALSVKRSPYLDRAKEFATLTLPYVMPETDDDWTGSGDVKFDWQSFGADLVNYLANKYMNALFPPARPFFRIFLPQEVKVQLDQQFTAAAVQFQLSMIERSGLQAFEAMNPRQALLEAMKHLIIAGNVLLFVDQDDNIQTYALSQYVCRRSLSGRPVEIITRDRMDASTMDAEYAAALTSLGYNMDDYEKEQMVTLYTHARWDAKKKKWIVNQAIEELPIGKESTYTEENMRWIPLRWVASRNEHYGRSLVEEHSGNFYALSILTQALCEGAVAITDIKYLVDTSAVLNIAALTESKSGAYVAGKANAVTAVQSGKLGDFRFVSELVDFYKRELSLAFLKGSAATRQAERVTAEEIRLQAGELEQGHAGVFSGLANDLQKPLAKIGMERSGVSSELKALKAKPLIITGLEAIGRTGDLEAMRLFIADISQVGNWPEEFRERLKATPFLQTVGSMHGVDYTPFLMGDEEKSQSDAASQQQMAMQKGLSDISGGLGNAVGKMGMDDLATMAPAMQQMAGGMVQQQ